jgi:hypothetical protein
VRAASRGAFYNFWVCAVSPSRARGQVPVSVASEARFTPRSRVHREHLGATADGRGEGAAIPLTPGVRASILVMREGFPRAMLAKERL